MDEGVSAQRLRLVAKDAVTFFVGKKQFDSTVHPEHRHAFYAAYSDELIDAMLKPYPRFVPRTSVVSRFLETRIENVLWYSPVRDESILPERILAHALQTLLTLNH